MPEAGGARTAPSSTAAAAPSTTGGPRLLGDIGGTHARFAWQAGPDEALTDLAALPGADHPSLADAMRAYLGGLGRAAPPLCAFGIANPITGDTVRMTNRDWSFSIAALQREFGFERLVVLNDFTALALALPTLAPDEYRQLGGGPPVPNAPIGLIGPGTGLGVSGLVPCSLGPSGAGPAPNGSPGGGWIPLQGEGGHVTLAATNDREAAVLARLRGAFGHVSAERAVSGPGLEALYAAVCRLDGRTPEPTGADAASISARAVAASDPQAVEALDLFCAYLGITAGNLALTLGARGGVFVGGGIVPRLGETFFRSRFRAAFEAKGRFRDYLAAIPVFVIEAEVSPALRGAARAL